MNKMLLDMLMSDTKPFRKEFLMKRLKLKGKEGRDILKKELDALLKKKDIRIKGDLVFWVFKDVKNGSIRMNKKGFGFIKTEDETEDDYFCHGSKSQGAMTGDVVDFVTRKNINRHTGEEKTEAMVLRITERKSNKLVGEIKRVDADVTFYPDDKTVTQEIKILNPNKGMDGEKAVFNIEKYGKRELIGTIGDVLGHKDDPGVDILSMIHAHHIDIDFSDETLKEVESVPVDIDPKDIPNREDIRGEITFTIDGADSKDLDDAITLKMEGKNYILGVHIADVSHYVEENTSLDEDAFKRGTSVYLLDRVIPMLPRKLSNGICSVNPNVDRYALSCDITMSPDGEVLRKRVYKSVINSKYRMTYKDVNKIIAGDEAIRSEYPELTPIMDNAIKLSHAIRAKKKVRGTIDFEVDEPKFILDERGKIKDIIKRSRGEAEMLIEDFMVTANESVSELMSENEFPFVYRNHDKPKSDKFVQFLSVAKIFQHSFDGDVGELTPKSVQEFIKKFDGNQEAEALRVMMLRSMSKAIYEPVNGGHFGLASTAYSHFTSPIRRYPDLIVHRLLKKYIVENKKVDREWESKIKKKLPFMTDHCTQKEMGAVACERDVTKLKMCEYMENHVGETFEGKVSGVTGFGFFVQLDSMVDGLVHNTSLTDDEYIYDEKTMTMIGNRTKKKYMIGDKVTVDVIGASKADMTIDFKIHGMKDPEPQENKPKQPSQQSKKPKEFEKRTRVKNKNKKD